jgi:hypothetical protein
MRATNLGNDCATVQKALALVKPPVSLTLKVDRHAGGIPRQRDH